MALLLSRSPITKAITSTPTNFIRHSSSALPRILQPALWKNVLPRFIRTAPSPTSPSKWAARLSNPATPVTILALLCGSQAIHVLTLKNSLADQEALRKRKIGLLNDVIERIMRGESVDVRRELGTGDEVQEREWREVIDGLGDANTWLKEPKPRRKPKVENGGETGESSKFSLPSLSWPSWSRSPETASVKKTEQVETEEIPERPSFV